MRGVWRELKSWRFTHAYREKSAKASDFPRQPAAERGGAMRAHPLCRLRLLDYFLTFRVAVVLADLTSVAFAVNFTL
jgi:hypothetical protein